MRDESDIREKLEAIDGDWSAVEEMNVDPTANPQVGAVARTLQWVLEDEIE